MENCLFIVACFTDHIGQDASCNRTAKVRNQIVEVLSVGYQRQCRHTCHTHCIERNIKQTDQRTADTGTDRTSDKTKTGRQTYTVNNWLTHAEERSRNCTAAVLLNLRIFRQQENATCRADHASVTHDLHRQQRSISQRVQHFHVNCTQAMMQTGRNQRGEASCQNKAAKTPVVFSTHIKPLTIAFDRTPQIGIKIVTINAAVISTLNVGTKMTAT